MDSSLLTVLFLPALGVLIFVALPLTCARSGRHRAVVSALLAALAGVVFVFFLAADRLAWEEAPSDPLERELFNDGVRAHRRAARPLVELLFAPMVGFAILGLVPRKSEPHDEDVERTASLTTTQTPTAFRRAGSA